MSTETVIRRTYMYFLAWDREPVPGYVLYSQQKNRGLATPDCRNMKEVLSKYQPKLKMIYSHRGCCCPDERLFTASSTAFHIPITMRVVSTYLRLTASTITCQTGRAPASLRLIEFPRSLCGSCCCG